MALVGRIARPHGLRGEVIVDVETDFPLDRFRLGARLFVERHGAALPLTLTSVRFQRERAVVGLSGVEDAAAAKGLAGAELRVPAADLVTLPPGMFYRHDLVGCRVITRTGDTVGVVTGVDGTVDGSRLVVDTPEGQVLIPLVAAICPTVDPVGKRIVIEPPDGLLDVNRSTA
jgi:16S rRNA processing protein RimM